MPTWREWLVILLAMWVVYFITFVFIGLLLFR